MNYKYQPRVQALENSTIWAFDLYFNKYYIYLIRNDHPMVAFHLAIYFKIDTLRGYICHLIIPP